MTDSRILRWIAWRLADYGIFRVSIEETFKRKLIAPPLAKAGEDEAGADEDELRQAASG